MYTQTFCCVEENRKTFRAKNDIVNGNLIFSSKRTIVENSMKKVKKKSKIPAVHHITVSVNSH